jgi:glycosyltransferase involved in cell wall biosynthesis
MTAARPRWRYQGMVRSNASWALVAGHLIRALHARGTDVELEELVADRFDADCDTADLPLAAAGNEKPEWVFSFEDPRLLRRAPPAPLMLLTVTETTRMPIPFAAPLRRADRVVVPSHFVANACYSAGVEPDRVRIVPHGFDPRVFGWSKQPGRRKTRILFLGTSARRKGLDILLASLSRLADAAHHCTLVLKLAPYRDAERRPYLLADWRESVARLRSLGFEIDVIEAHLPVTALRQLIDSADIVCHPHRGEGFGIPLLEAAVCGRAIVTTDWGGPPEFLPADGSILLPAECEYSAREQLPEPAIWPAEAVLRGPRVDAVAEAVATLVGDPPARRRLGEAAHGATRHMSWDHAAAQLLAAAA